MKRYALNAEVLDQWQQLTGRTDAELAKMADVNHTSLSKWRNGTRHIPLAAAEELSTVTGIPRSRLIRRIEDDPAPRSGRERRVDAALGNVLRGTRADAKAAS